MSIKDLNLSNIPENGAIIREVLRVQRKGKMNVVHVIGLPGTGKSWYCLRLAEQLAKEIHGDEYKITERNVVDDLLSLLRFIRAVKRPGEIVIGEELGVWLNSKRAMSAENVDASYVWDTLRKKRIIVLGNNPIRKEIDKSLQVLSTMQIQTLSLNKTLGICIVKPFRLQANPDTGKVYRHRLHTDGREVHRCWSGKPSKELTDAYEKSKDDFLEALYKRLEDKHEKKREDYASKIGGKVGAITPLEHRRARLRGRGLSTHEIAVLEGVSDDPVRVSLIKYDIKIKKIQNLEKTDKESHTPQQVN